MASANIPVLILRANELIRQSKVYLQQLTDAGNGQGHSVYDELDSSIWTMEGTILAYENGTLRLGDPTNPDGTPLAPDVATAVALGAPPQVLEAAQNKARLLLSAQGGGLQP